MRAHAVRRRDCIQGQQKLWRSTWRGGVEVKAVLDSVLQFGVTDHDEARG
jgi:hypothetical protein